MSVERAVKTWLDTFAKAYPGVLPSKKAPDPAIVYSVEYESRDRALSGGVRSGTSNVDVNIYGTGYEAVKTLAKQIQDAADNLSQPNDDWNGLAIYSGRCQAVRELPYESDTKYFHVVVEVTLFTKEA